MKLITIAVILLIPLGGRAGDLAALFEQLHPRERLAESKGSRTDAQANAEEREITEVALEHAPWYNKSDAVYSVLIRNDGSYTFIGYRNVKPLGKHTGRLSMPDVKPLFQYLREMDYSALDDFYSTETTDQPIVYTMVSKNGHHKVVRNEGNAGPLKLWALERLIDGLVAKAHWDDGGPFSR